MNTRTIKTMMMGLVVSITLNACSAMDRIENIGEAPKMSKIENPQLKTGYQPVSMPMPAPQQVVKQPNSLWSSDRKSFFKDQRASKVGDILTVLIDINDQVDIENKTNRTRATAEGAQLPALLGMETQLSKVLPEAVDPSNLAEAGSDSSYAGTGKIQRDDSIEVKVAAVVTQVLPNGNLVISGKQEALANYDKRIIQIDGIIRPEDISVDNTISHDQIAEARIVYGGEGQIMDVQQPRYGQQLYDIVFPF